jgi:hypothetical protein
VVIEDDVLLVAELALLEDALIELFQVVLSETVVLEEALDLVIDILGETWALIAILHLEFVDEQALELLTLLDVKEAFPAGVTVT